MKVLLSHSIAEADGPVASRLRAVAAAYDVTLLLPARDLETRPGTLSKANRALIEDADAVLALVTTGSKDHAAVEAEVKAALAKKKPLVFLTEKGAVALASVDAPVHLVRFDRQDPAGHELALGEALAAIRAHNGRERARQAAVRNAIAIGAIAGIAVGLLALGAASIMLGPNEPSARLG